MMSDKAKLRRDRIGVAFGLAIAMLALAGCRSGEPVEVPPFYRDLARVDTSVDQATAAQMISQYRMNSGKGSLAIDPALTAIAQAQAQAIASADNVRASLEPRNQLKTRLASVGETKTYAVENVSAGYRTLAEAFSGWRDSPNHNAVMLDDKVTRMGIATAYASGSKYKVFWSLVLASPKP
ncbi:CAP domain-containing protein [Polymorphum gilvum]|nr:CAP domain-containing protein [Polymorphum gilvum]